MIVYTKALDILETIGSYQFVEAAYSCKLFQKLSLKVTKYQKRNSETIPQRNVDLDFQYAYQILVIFICYFDFLDDQVVI